MKKIFSYSCLLFAMNMAMMLLSCKKSFLDLRHPAALAVEDALKTEADLKVALNGVYNGLRAIDLYGRTIPVIGDVLADNAYNSINFTMRYLAYNLYQVPANDVNALGLWTGAYQVILRCNNIINANVPSSPNVNQYKGEAYSVRALLYFTLINFFAAPYKEDPNSAGVPIVKEFNQNLLPARNTVTEVYDIILNDLVQATSLMTQYTNSSQFSKFAARALEAKVYLYKGDNTNARIAALDVINNGGFSIVNAANYKAYWDDEKIRVNKVETIFEVSSDAVGNNGFNALGYIYSPLGYGEILCSDELYGLYANTDVRRMNGMLTTGVRAGMPVIFVNKYPDISGDRSDTKILRLSEIYLIAAEASFLTNEMEARGFLNYVATRRDASFTGYTSTGATLFEDIIKERRKELAFEGDRFHDLNRLKRTIQRSNNYPPSARTINYPDYRRLLPIPQEEIDANPNIQQNPGY